MRRVWFRYAVLGVLIAQLAVLGYVARLTFQIRAIDALTYVEVSSH